MPLDFTPEPLGFRGFGVSPKPDEKETTGEPVFISDRPGDDEPQEPTQKLTLGESAADAGTFVRQSLDPIGSVVDIGKRLWQGKAPLTPSQKRLAETDYVGAATRQQNWLFSGLPHAPDFGPADPDHNPLVDIWGTPLGVYWPAFVGSRNAQETEWIKSKLLRELEDRRVLAENPVLGTLLEMGASLASPTNLLPGGTIYKGIKGFNKVSALAKSVLSTGVPTGVAVGIDEYILHQQQIARTLEESQMAVVGGVVLGGLFGGLIGARHGGVVAREIAVLERDLTKAVRVPERSADDPFGEGGLKALQSAGAKAVDDLSPVEMKSAAGLERLGDVGTKWWSRAWRGDGPLTRNLRSPFQSARDTGTRLYETPLTLTRNAMGEPTARDGLPVETAIKVHGESRLGEAMRQQDEFFADYYFGAQKAALKAIRAEANRVMGDNRMTLKQFREEVSRAMRRQDAHPVPQVAAAADMWRKVLFDPIADRAVRYNLYDAETIARGRPGWTPPDPAPPAPSGPPRPGGPRSGGEQPFDFARMREIEMSLLKIQSELGLPNLSGAMRDAFLERISAAIDDVTADQVSRALVDIIEGRIPRVEIDPEIAGRLRSVLEARQGAEAAGVAEDAATAVQEALTRLREVLPEGMVDRALRTLSDAFAGKLPTVDEIVDLFRPQMESMPAPKIDPLSPFGVRQNYVRDQVESVLDMWRFATMTPRKPPESLVSWIVRNGGVMDDAGELLSMLGSYRQRPGLVRKPGPDVPKLDDVTLRAWEEGFLLGPERPEINVLLDAIDRDLRGDAVVRIGDVEALDNWRMAGEVRRELKDLGIRSGMSDETVRKIAEREALRRYDAGETGPAAAMQNGHTDSVMALANVRIMKGQPVLVGAHVHDKIKTALGDDIKLVAENTMLATVTSLKPGKMIRYQGELTREVTVSVRGFGDEATSFKLPWSVLKDVRAFAVPAGWIPGLDRPLIIFHRLAFAEPASRGLRGELWHELVHNTVRQLRSSPLTLPLWRRLVDHVNGLRVLDMSQQQYYAGIRHPSATRAPTDETMRDLYNALYVNRLDFQDMIDEESVAHFVELWRHGQWPKMDIEPVADLLSALEKGELKTTEGIKKLLEAERLRVEIEQAQIATDRAAMKKASEDMMFAVEARHGSPEDLAAVGPSGQKPKPKANDPEFIKRVYQRLYDEVYRDVYEPKAPQKGEPPQFDKELADIIWDDGGKPQSYLFRLYSRERILADLPRFKDILTEHFAGGQRRAQSLLDKLRDEIKRGVRRLDAKTEKQIEDLHAFTGLERADLQSSAEQVINHILKTPDGRLVLDLPEAVRGPLRARTLRIRDSLIEDFLENDIDVVGRAYARHMVPQIEMVRQFGDLNMTRDMQRIIDEADALMTQRPKAEHARIQKAKEYAIRDLAAMRDRLLGTYKLPEDPTALVPRVSSFVRALNYLRLLGGMTLAAFPDIARTIMVQKFAVFSDGLVPFLHGLEGFKGAASEVRLAGTAWDMVLDTRAMSIADVLDDFGRYSKLERGVASAQNRFGVISLMAPWNAALKQWVGMIVMSKILRAADDVLAGKALKPKVVEALASANLTEDVLRIIAEQAKLHGGKKGGVYLPNSTAWDVTKPGVSEALELFRGAIVRDVDRTIITPGQEKPLWISTQLGKVAGQFKTFGLSSMQRTTMAGLQDRDAGVVMGALMMVGLGAISEVLKNKVSGKDNPKTTAQWLAQAIDKSGLTGWVMDVNHFTERFTGGMIGVSALTGRPISRYASRNWADAVAGPTGGLIKDMAGSSSGFFRWMFNNEKPTESDVRALRRMIPMQNLFYLAWLFRELEEGTAKAIGARPSPKRN